MTLSMLSLTLPIAQQALVISKSQGILRKVLRAHQGVLTGFMVYGDGPMALALKVEIDAVHFPGFEGQAVLVKKKFHLRAGQPGFLEQLSAGGFFHGVAIIDFAAWQTPFTGSIAGMVPPQDQHEALIIGNDQADDGNRIRILFFHLVPR